MFAYIVVVVSAVALTNAFPTGAPQSACFDMVPGHLGAKEQEAPPPYTITTPIAAVKAGDSVEVTLSGRTADATMRGILLQARQGDKIVGKWTVEPDDTFAQLMDCGEPGNAVTHKKHPHSLDKTTVTYRWTAPADLEGPVSFFATIVKSFTVFWVKVESAPVNIVKH